MNQSQSLTIADVATISNRVLDEVERAVIGKRQKLQMMMAAFLTSGGHVLLEDFPGLAKTLVANSFATALGMSFKRIQFTPDLLPGDITGGYIFDRAANTFVLRKGPVFANVVLGDEINRASPRTQSALLEAMQEYQVTLEGDSIRLDEPFIVIATQNPIEYEGTFPLPEAQLDRFLLKLSLGYPTAEEEQRILQLRRERGTDRVELSSVVDRSTLLAMRDVVETVHVHPDVEAYIVAVSTATRNHRHVVMGASPRGSLALVKVSRTWAVLNGRDFVLPDDVKLFAHAALAHRLMLRPESWGLPGTAEQVVTDVLSSVPVPVAHNAGRTERVT